MNSTKHFLHLQADDWLSCFEDSLLFLRESWPHHWMGLPAVLQASCDFLQLQKDDLSPAAASMLNAAFEIASDSEQRCQNNSQLDEPKYHNRLHTADVISCMALQLAIETKLSGLRDADWLAAGLLAAVAHDFMHSGGVNVSESQIEKLSCVFMRPSLSKHAVPQDWMGRIETAIIRSDFALAAQNHHAVQGLAFEWNQDWLNVLLNEADLLPSSSAVVGPALSEALAREWMLIGDSRYKTVATEEGRQAFLRGLIFSSLSAHMLISPDAWRGQRQH